MAFCDVFVQGRQAQAVREEFAEIDQALSVNQFVEEPRLFVPLVARDDEELLRLVTERIGEIAGISRVALRVEKHNCDHVRIA